MHLFLCIATSQSQDDDYDLERGGGSSYNNKFDDKIVKNNGDSEIINLSCIGSPFKMTLTSPRGSGTGSHMHQVLIVLLAF